LDPEQGCSGTEHNNRLLTAGAHDMFTAAVCFGSCSNICGSPKPDGNVEITFQLKIRPEEVSADGIFLSGGDLFGHGETQNELKCANNQCILDDDGLAVHMVTASAPKNSVQTYIFTNGQCSNNWECKEQIGGQRCAAWWSHNDRLLYVGGEATTLDVVTFAQCDTVLEANLDVTFYVDMRASDYLTVQRSTSMTGTWTNIEAAPGGGSSGVFLAGGGTFGVPGDYKMLDDDQDGIYEITIPLAKGSYHLFGFVLGTNRDWGGKENLLGHGCAVGEFNDREVAVGANEMTVGPFCFGKCCACDSLVDFTPKELAPPSPPAPAPEYATDVDTNNKVDVTFLVDMGLETFVEDTIYIAGGEYFGEPPSAGGSSTAVQLSSVSGSNTLFSASVALTAGEKYHMILLNGQGPSSNVFEARENLQGQECADRKTVHFERTLYVPNTPRHRTTVDLCFGTCGACADVRATVDLTILVDMDRSEYSVSRTGMFLAGGGTFGLPGDNQMMQVDDSTVYSIVVQVAAWTNHRYIFSNGNYAEWAGVEDLSGAPCAYGASNEREFQAREADTTLGPFCFGKCCSCDDGQTMITMTVMVTVINEEISESGIYLAGGTFGAPSEALRMLDDGSGVDVAAHDGVYSIAVQVPATSHHYYTFTNGLCEDYSCRENIATKPCAFGAFGDRYVGNTGTIDFTVEHCFGHCALCASKYANTAVVQSTFDVDMKGQTVSDDGVYLSGGRFGPPGMNAAMKMRPKSGTLYTITVPVPANGLFRFKFANGACDDYTCAEPLTEDQVCTQMVHADRVATVGDTAFKFGPVCFGECGTACGAKADERGNVDVTFRVKVDSKEVSDDGLFIAGGTAFGNPGDNKLVLNTRSGLYEHVFRQLPVGSALTFAYTNGNCPGWQCKESLAGKGCAADWSWDDRAITVPSSDTILDPVFFGHCGLFVAPKVDVTFYVDLSQGVYNTVGGQLAVSPHDVHEQGVYLAGGGTFGVPGDNMMAETSDHPGSKVYAITMQLEQGSTHAFSFHLGDDVINWQGREQLQGHSCANGEWNDREITVGGNNMIVGPLCFGQCCECKHRDLERVDVTFSVDMIGRTVADAGVFLAGGAFFGPMEDKYKMIDDDGDQIYEITVSIPAESHQHYVFTNGKCGIWNDPDHASGDWSCREQLAHSKDKACQRVENFNDREMIALDQAILMPTVCFAGCGECLIRLMSNGGRRAVEDRSRRVDGEVVVAVAVEVTFRLNTDFSSFDAETVAVLRADKQPITDGEWSVTGGGVFGFPGDNKMTLKNGSTTMWEFTKSLLPGAYKYVFVNSYAHADWGAEDQVKGLECIDHEFTTNQWLDRDLIVPDDGSTTMEFTICFSQCSPQCIQPARTPKVAVTFRTDMALVHQTASAGIFLAGGGTFGIPGENKMEPTQICEAGEACHTWHSITLMLKPGSYFYTLSNGEGTVYNPWESKEDIEGQPCVGNQYADRKLVVKGGIKTMAVDSCFGGCGTCHSMLARRVSVTFKVDMKYSEEAVDPAGIFLAGGGTFGVPGDNQMKQVGDSTVYILTYEVPAYTHHSYTFSNGGNTDWSGKEVLNGKSCATGYYDDRAFEVHETDRMLGPFCFGKCCACDDASEKLTITFKLTLLNLQVSDEGLYLAGGTFGEPGTTLMLDDGMGADYSAHDGIYTVSVKVPANTHQYYTFTNGACKGYECRENILEKPCAFGTFGDRYVQDVGTEDFTVEACWGHCSRCSPPVAIDSILTKVAFYVDMGSVIAVDPAGVYLAGGPFGAPGVNPAYKMTRSSNSAIYTISVSIPGNRIYNFKFSNGVAAVNANVDDLYAAAELFPDDAACTQSIHNDRVISIGTDPYMFGPVCFAGCGACGDGTAASSQTADVTFQVRMESADVSSEGLYLAGATLFGMPGDRRMIMDSATGFYTHTVKDVPVGSALTYAYTNGACINWQCKESLGGKGCAAPWHYGDRVLYVPEQSVTLPPVWFAHCSLTKSRKVDVTFYVELSQGVYNTVGGQKTASPHDVHKQGIYLAGGGTFGVPGDNLMHPTDDDHVYAITVQLEQGSTHNFAFVLGNDTQNWSGKETLYGHGCAVAEWSDRQITVGNSDMLIGPYCFGQCCSCDHRDITTVDVTFSVDMNGQTVAETGVFLAGGVLFGAMEDKFKMNDADGDGVYEITVAVPAESHQHYTFTNGRCSAADWSCKENLIMFEVDKICQRPEHYNEREFIALTANVVMPTVCFGGCGPCDGSLGFTRGDSIREGQADRGTAVEVTFHLNTDFAVMNANATTKLRDDKAATEDGVWSVAGGGVFGAPGDNKMTLKAGSTTVFEFKIKLNPGTYEYIFVNSHNSDGWGAKESLVNGLAAKCVEQNLELNIWSDRTLVIPDDGRTDVAVAFCFGQCEPECLNPPAVEDVKMIFHLDMALVHSVSLGGVFIAGGNSFGNPGDNPMAVKLVCDQGEVCHNYYTFEMMMPVGTHTYTYTNGMGNEWNPWITKEDVQGQACAKTQWNDRQFTVDAGDASTKIITECFGGCGTCEDMLAGRVEVTFLVDLGDEIVAAEAGVFVAGGGTFGTPGDNPMALVEGSSSMYKLTYEVPAFTHHNYAFVNGADISWSGKELLQGAPCAVGLWDDRGFEAQESDITLGPFCFGKCCTCNDGNRSIQMTVNVQVPEGVSAEGLFIVGGVFGAPGNLDNQLVDPDGDGVYSITVAVPSQAHFYFALANGNCPKYLCKENLAELPCGQGTWGDRYVADSGNVDFAFPDITFGVCNVGDTDGTGGGNNNGNNGGDNGGGNGGGDGKGGGLSDTDLAPSNAAFKATAVTLTIIGATVGALVLLLVVGAVYVIKRKNKDLPVVGGLNAGATSFDNPQYTAGRDVENPIYAENETIPVIRSGATSYDGPWTQESSYMDLPADFEGGPSENDQNPSGHMSGYIQVEAAAESAHKVARRKRRFSVNSDI
jgi:hypothetical protein